MRVRKALIAPLALACALAFSGCQDNNSPAPAPDNSAKPAPEEWADATFVKGGTAAQNKPFFDRVNHETMKTHPEVTRAIIVEALSKGGFDEASMEASPDQTPTGLEVDYHLVSVKIGGECLIGQIGVNGYTSMVAGTLETGKCLFGEFEPLA